MIVPHNTVAAIKRDVQNLYKKPVKVRLDLGRNKFITFNATLSGVYPSIFTVKPEEDGFLGKTAYSYSEILCGKVTLLPAERQA